MTPQQEAVGEAVKFVTKFNQVIVYPTIALLTGVGFLVFLYGCAQYVINSDNDSAREEGVRHITWGIIGLVVMVTAWSILGVAAATFGLNDELDCANDPTQPQCATKFAP